jgi:hypothetical protein
MTSPSATEDSNPYQNQPIWSRSEKAIARKAFDAALGQELHEVIQEAKRMANEIQKVIRSVGPGTLPDATPQRD